MGPNGPFGVAYIEFDWPAIAGVLGTRSLVVSAIDLTGGLVGIRVDAEDIWITPRPVWEQIPVGVGSVSIIANGMHGSSAPIVVRSPARVHTLVALVDGLPLAQPGVYHCPVSFGPAFVLRFLASPSLLPLAVASTEQACNGVSFKLGGTEEPGLNGAYQLVEAVNRLGVVRNCLASQLRAQPPSVQAGAQATFTFTSATHKLCLLRGYPRLVVRDGHGARLPLAVLRLPNSSPVTGDVTPGEPAAFSASWTEPTRVCSDPAATVQVALPGRHAGSLVIPLPRHARIRWPCRGRFTLQPFWPQP